MRYEVMPSYYLYRGQASGVFPCRLARTKEIQATTDINAQKPDRLARRVPNIAAQGV